MKLMREYYLCLFTLYVYCRVIAHGKEYIGCFEYKSDDLELDVGLNQQIDMEHNNGHLCIKQFYPHFMYAGTEGAQCFCGNVLIGRLVDDKWCDTPCPDQQDNHNTTCGGTFRMSVYDLHPNSARGDMRSELIGDFPGTTRGWITREWIIKETVTIEKTSIGVTVCAIGTFAVVCFSVIVKLILFMKKLRLNKGRSTRGEDGYIRPMYSSTTGITSEVQPDNVQSRVHIYESVENAKMDD